MTRINLPSLIGTLLSSVSFRASPAVEPFSMSASETSFQQGTEAVRGSFDSQGLLDLERATEERTVHQLLRRASLWNFRRLAHVRSEDLVEDPLQQLLYVASLGDVFAAAQFAKSSSASLEKSLRKMGCDSETIAFARNYVYERSRVIVDKLNIRQKEDRRRLAAEFLEMALHSRQEIGVCLFLARRLATLSGLDWKGLVEERRERTSYFEKELIAWVREEGGTVPFDRFFEQAMFHPYAGTYTGRTADHLISADPAAEPDAFFTTAATDPVLAKSLVSYARGLWERLGKPERFDLVEMGAGMGRLAEGILDYVGASPADDRFRSAVRYRILEKSSALVRIQQDRLGRFGNRVQVLRYSAICGRLPRVEAGLFFSNELVDMFPPRKIVNAGGRLQESFIAYRGGLFQEVPGPLREETRAFLEDRAIWLAAGETYYIQPDIDVWVASLAQALGAGDVVTIDYGERRERLRKTRHEFGHSMFRGFLPRNDPKVAIGLVSLQTYKDSPTGVARPKDLTVDVDFTTIEEAARRAQGLHLREFLSQKAFYEKYSREKSKIEGFNDCRVSILSTTPA